MFKEVGRSSKETCETLTGGGIDSTGTFAWFQASPGNLAQVEDVLFGGNTQMSEAKGVMAVSVKFDGKQQVRLRNLFELHC